MSPAPLHPSMHEAAAPAAAMPNQFVTFLCDDRAFGLDIMAVREIRSWSPVTPLPKQSHAAKGVLDIRGRIVQVYDLATLLGASPGRNRTSTVVLVVSLPNADVGLVVDAVSDIIFATEEDLRSPPELGDGLVTALVKNEERLISILDLWALFPGESAGEDAYV